MRSLLPQLVAIFSVFGLVSPASSQGNDIPMAKAVTMENSRMPRDESELRYWLENMIWHHQFSPEEVRMATGLSLDEVEDAVDRLGISANNRPKRTGGSLLVLPYPGGRHPRIGFLKGAINPQRETKISVFTPWDDSSYVVLDIPEGIWSDLGLTYLAHTHIPTIFDKHGKTLEKLEWKRNGNDGLEMQRRLPNGITFGTKVQATKSAVRLEMWLTNGTDAPLSDLRVQNCAMLKYSKGFEQLTNENKLYRGEYALCRSDDGQRWLIHAWSPIHRGWGNAPCPCLHADPKFPDCKPNETQRLRGWFSFYEGDDIDAELERIDDTKWQQTRLP